MGQFILTEGLYLYPTPAGAYYAVISNAVEQPRQFIRQLLLNNRTFALNPDNLKLTMQQDDMQACFELLQHCQNLGWLQGLEETLDYPAGALGEILPSLLEGISDSDKVLLADSEGFNLCSYGFSDAEAEILSALSAELANKDARLAGMLGKHLGLASHAWSMVDAFGNSQIGFWPLYIGNNRFVLVISGTPHFNQPDFVSLVWALSVRYGNYSV
ncbi:MAG: roadblock/LC7 domain-containing protein [Methylococcaceae bacterium]